MFQVQVNIKQSIKKKIKIKLFQKQVEINYKINKHQVINMILSLIAFLIKEDIYLNKVMISKSQKVKFLFTIIKVHIIKILKIIKKLSLQKQNVKWIQVKKRMYQVQVNITYNKVAQIKVINSLEVSIRIKVIIFQVLVSMIIIYNQFPKKALNLTNS